MGRIKENFNLIVADIKESSRNIKELVATFISNDTKIDNNKDLHDFDGSEVPTLIKSQKDIESGDALVNKQPEQPKQTLDQLLNGYSGIRVKPPTKPNGKNKEEIEMSK